MCILTNLNWARYHTAATAKLTTNIQSDMNYVDIVGNLDTEFRIRIWAAYQSATHMFFETIVSVMFFDRQILFSAIGSTGAAGNSEGLP